MADSPRPASPADRNLLFGILALQMDFVDRDQLVAAMNAWVLAKDRSIGQILCKQGTLKPAENELLDALVLRHLSRHKEDVRESLASLAPLTPLPLALTGQFDVDLQASLAFLPTASPPSEIRMSSVSTITEPRTGPPHGRFRILRPHARGGLGEVFVAEDEELHREVALKEMQDRHADRPDSRSRFLLEAEITGGLEHPGIVPVYSLGQYGDGRPFYAMRFIRGDSLAEAIARFHGQAKAAQPATLDFASLPFRQLLRRFVDVCNAISYAHSRGVLHRDLKPGNILLGKYGETLVVDWGLAKPLGRAEQAEPVGERLLAPASGSGRTPTHMGSVIGTPPYMSPEQAAGLLDQLGPASDVYGLGATLYHIMTGRPPFESQDVGEVLRQVGRGEFPRPRSVRPEIPRQLEAACLKAMALSPGNRYPSVRELALDVEHWLADEAVTAYQDPLLTRAGRWARRRRTAVATAATFLIVALAASITGIVLLGQKNREIEAQRAEAVAARDRAEANFMLARDAVDKTLTGVAENAHLKEDDYHDLRLSLLRSALPFYEEFVKQESNQPRLILERGRALGRLADLRLEMGDTSQAREAYGQAQDILARLVAHHPEVPAYQLELATSYNNLGELLHRLGALDEARDAHLKALAIRRELVDTNPELVEVRHHLASSHINLGLVQAKLGELLVAEQSYEAALKTLRSLLENDPKAQAIRQALAACFIDLGNLQVQLGKSGQAEESIRAALDIEKQLAQENPKAPQFRHTLGTNLNNLAIVQMDLGKIALSQDSFQKSLAVRKDLVEANPKVPEYRLDVAVTQVNWANLLRDLGKFAEADRLYTAAAAIYEPLIEEYPKMPAFRQALAKLDYNAGYLYRKQGKFAEASKSYGRALARQRQLVKENSQTPAYREELASYLNSMGVLQQSLRKTDEAEKCFHEALAIQEALAREDPRVTAYRVEVAESLNNLGTLHAEAGRNAQAEKAFRIALANRKTIVEQNPRVQAYRHQLGSSYRNLGLFQRLSGSPTEAEQSFREALAVLRALVDENAAMPAYRRELAQAHNSLAILLLNVGRLKEAGEEYALAEKLGDAAAANNRKQCLEQAKLLDKLPAILSGKEKPADASDAIGLALLCSQPWQARNRAAAQFFGQAFALDMHLADDLERQHRYNAACAAALAGCGQGKDADTLTADEMTKLRSQALTWLETDLVARSKQLQNSKAIDKQKARQALTHWLQDTDLAGVRGSSIDKLPDAEQPGWRTLWQKVTEMLKKA